MIHIAKSNKTGEFQSATIGTNGEELSSSELVSSKQKAIENIAAHLESWNSYFVYAQDDTPVEPMLIAIYPGGKHEPLSEIEIRDNELKIHPKHIIGKK